MNTSYLTPWLMGGLNEKEYFELLGLEYVLTWQYTDDIDRDEKRYKELSDRKWKFREENPTLNK